jgi:hypothetical protein
MTATLVRSLGLWRGWANKEKQMKFKAFKVRGWLTSATLLRAFTTWQANATEIGRVNYSVRMISRHRRLSKLCLTFKAWAGVLEDLGRSRSMMHYVIAKFRRIRLGTVIVMWAWAVAEQKSVRLVHHLQVLQKCKRDLAAKGLRSWREKVEKCHRIDAQWEVWALQLLRSMKTRDVLSALNTLCEESTQVQHKNNAMC